jgi:tetratricopeptide (TPR) repeat protein
MRKIAFLFLVMVMSITGMAQVDQWFAEGNEAYNEGDYDQALMMYGNIEGEGVESADLYYNLGNTYYKMRQYPQAILYFEKALKLAPGDEDIRTNLEIANLAVVDKINVLPQSFIERWWNSLRNALSADGWAWVSIVAFALVLLCLFVFLMARRAGWRKTGFFAGLLLLVCLVLSVVFAFEKYQDLKHQDEAIVMTPTVTVKSSPSENSVDLFVLHEGTKVRIMDTSNGWNKIKIADGSIGWLQAEAMTAF